MEENLEYPWVFEHWWVLLLNCGDSLSLLKEDFISTGNAVDLPFIAPGTVFPKIEFFEIIRSLESLVDCSDFSDMFRSPVSLIFCVRHAFSCCSGVNLSCQSLLPMNYQFLLDVMYLKCLKNLFEIGKLLPWMEILLVGNLLVEMDLELKQKYYAEFQHHLLNIHVACLINLWKTFLIKEVCI